MQIVFVKPGNTVICGASRGVFLRMSGPDAIVQLDSGKRVMWSGTTEVEVLSEQEEIQENSLPKLEAELARLQQFTEGKYAKLGVIVETECAILPREVHQIFILAALGEKPVDAILCRRCGKKLCVRADHLFWGTRSDCQRDMCLRGVAKPSGKQISPMTIASKIVRLHLRIARLRHKLTS